MRDTDTTLMTGTHTSPIRLLVVSAVCAMPSYRTRFQRICKLYPDIEVALLVPSVWTENQLRHKPRLAAAERRLRNYRLIRGRIVGSGYPNRLLFVSELYTAIRRMAPDVIHLEFEPWSLVHLQALVATRTLDYQPKLVFRTSVGRLHYRTKLDLVAKAIYRLVLRRYQGAVCLNEVAMSEVRRTGIFSGATVVLPQEIDTRLFQPKPSRIRNEIRQTLGVDGHFCVGYVGRFAAGKGLDYLFRAFQGLQIPARLLMLGDGDRRSHLLELAKSLDIAGQIIWVPPCPREDVPKFMSAMDVLVLPSEGQEFFGRSVAEAMACGVPVIGARCGYIPYVIGGCGFTFSEANVEELLECLTFVTKAGDSLVGVTRAARQRVIDNFSVDVVGSRMVDFYRALGGAQERPVWLGEGSSIEIRT